MIAAQVDDAWKRFARLIGGEALAADTRFHSAGGRNDASARDPAARARMGRRRVRSRQCLAALDAIDVPCAKVQRIDEVLADPQIAARGMVIEQDHPVLGKVRLPNLPFRFSDCDTTQTMPAPLMGQHNREIAAELGYSAAEIDAMVKPTACCTPNLP